MVFCSSFQVLFQSNIFSSADENAPGAINEEFDFMPCLSQKI